MNEAQTLSNVSGSTQLQTEVNRKGLESLIAYHQKFESVIAKSRGTKALASRYGGVRSFEVLPRLSSAVEAESRDRGKDVAGVLLLSCHAARLMCGARTTSCKSAKDRTSVFQTLEVVRLSKKSIPVEIFSKSNFSLAAASDPLERWSLDALRGMDGVRLHNAHLNVGRHKYAFNQIQVEALPQELRPPSSTASGGKS